jgi:hypothetical protein
MANSSTLASERDEFLKCLAGIGQVLNGKPLPADKTSPQPDETSGVAGEPHCSGCMREFGLKI